MITKNILLIAAGLAMAAPAVAQEKSVTFVTFGGLIEDVYKKAYLEDFAKASGIKVVTDTYGGGIGALRAKLNVSEPNWDVIYVEAADLKIGCEEGLFETIDFARIGGKDQILPSGVTKCGLGATAANVTLGWDKDRLKGTPAGWDDFFDLKKFPGKRALRKTPRGTLEIALVADGVKPSEVYKVLATNEGVERALRKLETIKPDVIWWTAGAQPPQLLASGEVVMTSIFNARIDGANRNDKRNFGQSFNGAIFGVDFWAISRKSKHKDEAYALLKTLATAENQAKMSRLISIGGLNKGTSALLDEKVLADLPTSPANMANIIDMSAEFWIDNLDRLSARFESWLAAAK